MENIASTSPRLAVLGGRPAFPDDAQVPLIDFRTDQYPSDFSAGDAILHNLDIGDATFGASRQRVVAKILPGVGGPSISFRNTLQDRIHEFLGLDSAETSVLCVSSGTNALRAMLKWVRTTDDSGTRNEIIVPQTTVDATVEAVIAEGFSPVFAEVDSRSWLLSLESTQRSISDRTAAIITVDWLGTLCDLGPFRKLADEYDIKLISDSAQSFGASTGQPLSINLAHAVIYSMGYPKVFTGAGSGGLIVCSKSVTEVLKRSPSGILRHETISETDAFMCLQALFLLPKNLETRGKAGWLYRKILADIPGITLQRIPAGLATNYYQMSVAVDAELFGMEASDACDVLRAENVHCSSERMPCVAANKILIPHGRIEGNIDHSQRLAAASLTLPISNHISCDTVSTICGLVRSIHEKAQEIIERERNTCRTGAIDLPHETVDVTDLESKFPYHLSIPVLEKKCACSTILVPFRYLRQHLISIDELLECFTSQEHWSLSEIVLTKLHVDAIIGTVTVLAPHSIDRPVEISSPVPLVQSGSAANVTLVPRVDGTLQVWKHAVGDGIDGNGAPWLWRQFLFLENSIAAKKTGMFVIPAEVFHDDSEVTLVLPYIPSHSFGELVFANVGARSVVEAMVDTLVQMATSVWIEGQEQADSNFIQKAHFDRMKRRVEIARTRDVALDQILKQNTIVLNGKQMHGFETIMKRLERHPALSEIAPTILHEIHGDLNIHNILSRLTFEHEQCVALIDPRGVPLLSDSEPEGNNFERGDYCYDVSKLIFSLEGFSEIRKGFYDYSVDGENHKLEIMQHPGSATMRGTADILVPALVAQEVINRWIGAVERNGTRSFKLRVKLGVASHFVADCACAFGRNTPWEAIPLLLIGLQKLNEVFNMLEHGGRLPVEGPKSWLELPCAPESADLGATMIQKFLFGPTSVESWSFDVLEICVKSESADTLKKLIHETIGNLLPRCTTVCLSTDPVQSVNKGPLVLIHPFNGVRGQTHMLAAATRRTTDFFRQNGESQSRIDGLKIVHISSTGASSRSQLTSRANDKLLSPGIFGISPLRLALLQTIQLPFPKPGRWVLENDSFFLLSRPLVFRGDGLCLLAIERSISGSSSPWRMCIDKHEQSDGLLFAKGFRNIQMHEEGKKLMRTTTGLFLPHNLAKALSAFEKDYAERTSPLLVDVVLPRFMEREDWIRLSHQRGSGVQSHRVWENAKQLENVSSQVELAHGGVNMDFYHYGSDSEYHELLEHVHNDSRLNSLAYVNTAIRWLRRKRPGEVGGSAGLRPRVDSTYAIGIKGKL